MGKVDGKFCVSEMDRMEDDAASLSGVWYPRDGYINTTRPRFTSLHHTPAIIFLQIPRAGSAWRFRVDLAQDVCLALRLSLPAIPQIPSTVDGCLLPPKFTQWVSDGV